jgi:hypothetical protein
MKWLAIASVALLCGCHGQPSRIAKPAPSATTTVANPNEARLIGSWKMVYDIWETRVKYGADHTFSMRVGEAGLHSGYLEVSGTWSLDSKNWIHLTANRQSKHIVKPNKTLNRTIREYQRAFDPKSGTTKSTHLIFNPGGFYSEDIEVAEPPTFKKSPWP